MARGTLGDILVQMGAVDALQLRAAMAHQRQWGTPLGKALVEMRFCTWQQVLHALSTQAGIPSVDLAQEQFHPGQQELLSQKVAERHKVVPLRLEGSRGETLVVAMAAPVTLAKVDSVQAAAGKRIKVLLAADDAVDRALGYLYRGETTFAAPVEPHYVANLRDAEFELAAPEAPEVLVYGWEPMATSRLVEVFQSAGLSARAVTADEVLLCRADDVLLAPLPAVEQLKQQGHAAAAKVVVAGKSRERDLPRAREVGARGFVLAPLDLRNVVEAVKRCLGFGAEAA